MTYLIFVFKLVDMYLSFNFVYFTFSIHGAPFLYFLILRRKKKGGGKKKKTSRERTIKTPGTMSSFSHHTFVLFTLSILSALFLYFLILRRKKKREGGVKKTIERKAIKQAHNVQFSHHTFPRQRGNLFYYGVIFSGI